MKRYLVSYTYYNMSKNRQMFNAETLLLDLSEIAVSDINHYLLNQCSLYNMYDYNKIDWVVIAVSEIPEFKK